MMKSPKNWTVAVRDPKGFIHLRKEKLAEMPRFLRLPLVRGVVALAQALSLGIRAIEFSAQMAFDEKEDEKLGKGSIALTIVAAFLLGIALFILLPLYATKLVGMGLSLVSTSSFFFNLTDGIIRVLVFLLYVFLIGIWKDMARIFEYHGAEHKVIHAYEHGQALTLQNVRSFSPHHPRCGTSFLMIVMVVSILIFSFIPQSWPFLYKFLSRIILIPLIAGTSFEFLKLSARWKDNPVMRILILPGLLLQRFTTREPDDRELEVALAAMNEVLLLDKEHA